MIAGYSVWAILAVCVGVFFSGLVDAIGGGGGLISLPAYLIAGLPVHLALGTNKLSSCLGTTASTIRYLKNGYVIWSLALPSVVLAIVGSHIGTSLQLALDETVLRWVLIVVLIAVAAVMLKKKDFPEEAGEIAPWKQRLIVWLAAFVIGMYDGFYGPGAGTFSLIVFSRLAKMDLRTASGTVKVVNLSSNVSAMVTSLIAGKVLVPIGLTAAVFSFLGHYLGAGLMMKNGSKIVTPVILTVLTLLLVRVALELAGVDLFG